MQLKPRKELVKMNKTEVTLYALDLEDEIKKLRRRQTVHRKQLRENNKKFESYNAIQARNKWAEEYRKFVAELGGGE